MKTLEGMIVQDADRLDAIGAIGIARCFGVVNGKTFQPFSLEEGLYGRKLKELNKELEHIEEKCEHSNAETLDCIL